MRGTAGGAGEGGGGAGREKRDGTEIMSQETISFRGYDALSLRASFELLIKGPWHRFAQRNKKAPGQSYSFEYEFRIAADYEKCVVHFFAYKNTTDVFEVEIDIYDLRGMHNDRW